MVQDWLATFAVRCCQQDAAKMSLGPPRPGHTANPIDAAMDRHGNLQVSERAMERPARFGWQHPLLWKLLLTLL